MAIQDTDLLLINRAGASYKVAASNLVSKVQAGDLALVNRSGSSYKLTGDKLTSGTFGDTDLFIVNRAGASYQVAGSEIKTLLVPVVPAITSATWSFAGKQSDSSSFLMTVTFKSGDKIDLSVPTLAQLELVSRQSSSFASLQPVTNIGNRNYKADNWLNTTTATTQDIQPDFNEIDGGQKMSFVLYIPKNVSISGSTVRAKDSALVGTWTGAVGIYQNGVGYFTVTGSFVASDDFFA